MKALINRRTFLRCNAAGAGTLVALPLLESMFSSESAFADAPSQVGRFFGFYVPNGIFETTWFPNGGNFAGTAAEPFEKMGLTNDISFYKNIDSCALLPRKGGGQRTGNNHMRGISASLTGVGIDHHAVKEHVESIDQRIANWHKADGFQGIHSFQLAGNPELDSPLNRPYNNRLKNSLCFDADGKILENSANYQDAFDRMFSGNNSNNTNQAVDERKHLKISVLDQVSEHRKRFEKRLGQLDRTLIDQYFTSIAEVEKGLNEVVDTGDCNAPDVNKNSIPAIDGNQKRVTAFGQEAKLLAKIVATGFQCDIVRSVTFMAGGEAAGCSYTDIPGIKHVHFHNNVSHNRNKFVPEWKAIDKFHSDLVATFMKEMKDRNHGAGTCLDGTCVYYTSGLGKGGNHSMQELGLMVGGHFGNWKHSGKVHSFDKGKRYNSDLLNTVAREIGLPNEFGETGGFFPIE